MTIIGIIFGTLFILMIAIRMIGSTIELIWKIAGAVSQMVLFLVFLCILIPLFAS